MTKDEVLKLALEALEDYKYAEARTIIREALANVATNDTSQERVDKTSVNVHEPVAWAKFSAKGNIIDLLSEPDDDYTPLYTTPPQRKPLTDEEIILIVADCASSHQHTDIHFARAIEAVHGIKELKEYKK